MSQVLHTDSFDILGGNAIFTDLKVIFFVFFVFHFGVSIKFRLISHPGLLVGPYSYSAFAAALTRFSLAWLSCMAYQQLFVM